MEGGVFPNNLGNDDSLILFKILRELLSIACFLDVVEFLLEESGERLIEKIETDGFKLPLKEAGHPPNHLQIRFDNLLNPQILNLDSDLAAIF